MPVQNGTAGNDTLTGGALNDTLNGLGGNDVLIGLADLDILDGGAGNDSLDGGLMNDILKGGAGNDTLNGSVGEDTMTGGAGNDVYAVDDLDDQVIELAGGGDDAIMTELSGVSLSTYDNVEILLLGGLANLSATGSDRSDLIIGNGGANILTGGIGNDTLAGAAGDDTVKGGKGNDFYFVESASDLVFEAAGEGKDTVLASGNFTLTAGQEIEVLKLDLGVGSGTGNEFANTIIGNDGNNILDGGKGNDTLTGGKGNDIYFVDSADDKVTEAAGQGTDAVLSALASYTLGANVENLALSPTGISATGNALNNVMNGSSLGNTLDGGAGNDSLAGLTGADSLVGGAGHDTLNGGTGVDTMVGGAGNDTYFVDALADKVTEAAGGGVDLVQTSIDGFMLYDNVENMTLLGGTDLFAVGNKLGNFITGNGGANSINGLDGNDTLDGAGGADTLGGGKGNDTYFVDSVSDKVMENIGAGKDTVFAGADFTLGTDQEVEIITLTGGIDLEATGNNLANTINGDSGDNALDGLGANDTLNGNVGNDILDGGTGDDVMNGGKDSDTYFVDSSKDKITEAAGQGSDMVFSKASSFTLGANIENALMLIGAGNLTGNTLNNSIDGNSVGNLLDGGGGNDDLEGHDGVDTLNGGAGNDTLDGGPGDDKMAGGAGNDVYIVSSLADKITELAGGGTDLVQTEISGLTLAAHVENLELVSLGDISGTGNELSNYMKGSDGKNGLFGLDGNDTLDGGTNGDVLSGGKGNNTYFIDNALDIIFEGAGQGKDTVHSSVTFNFNDSVEIETLILSSTSAIGSVGNNFNNVITMTGTGQATLNGNNGNDTLTGAGANDNLLGGGGNDVIVGGGGNDNIFGDTDNDKLTGGEGNDTLNGGTGKDAMIGGKGDDLYFVAEIGDTVTELAGQGTDIVLSRLVNYTLAANVENLALDTGGINGTGNALGNLIVGNGADNKLDGGSGGDVLQGGNGNDSLLGGLGFDYLSGGSGNDTLKGGGDVDYLEGGSGADVMYGEAGKDGFLYRIDDPAELATLGGDIISGFQSGVDRIELSSLLVEFAIDPDDAISGGYVLLKDSGADTLVQFDQNGFGGSGPITLATVTNADVAVSDLMLDGSFIL